MLQIDCRMCNQSFQGEWHFNVKAKKNQAFKLVDGELVAHHIYDEDGRGHGCYGLNGGTPTDADKRPVSIELSPQQLNPSMDKDTMDKVERSIKSSGLAYEMALGMTQTAAQVGMKVDGIEQVVQGLDNKWTELAQTMRVVELHIPERDRTYKIEGHRHETLEMLLFLVGLRKSIWILGPAGSGKTLGVKQASEILGQKVYFKSMGPMVGADELYGYMNMANGEYVPTDLFRALTEGAIYCGDEMDRGNPGLNTQFNIIAEHNNRIVGFPHGQFEKHEDFCLVCTANTYGGGSDNVYIGANQQDGAFLSRFSMLKWDYDWAFVHKLSSNEKWVDYVKALHEAAARFPLPVVIGPREAIEGADLISRGRTWAEAAEIQIWLRTSIAIRRQIEATVQMRDFING